MTLTNTVTIEPIGPVAVTTRYQPDYDGDGPQWVTYLAWGDVADWDVECHSPASTLDDIERVHAAWCQPERVAEEVLDASRPIMTNPVQVCRY